MFLLSKHILWWSPFMAGSVQTLFIDSKKELFVNVLARDYLFVAVGEKHVPATRHRRAQTCWWEEDSAEIGLCRWILGGGKEQDLNRVHL